MDETTTKEHLAEANSHIADTETLIARQGEIIAERFAGGNSTEEAEIQLAVLDETLKGMQQRREQLLAKLRNELA
jgi:hypothetical protein